MVWNRDIFLSRFVKIIIMEVVRMVTALKVERVKKGIQQWRLATLLGISQTELSHYEVGRRRCPTDLKYRIAKILDTKVAELFPEGYDTEMERLRTHGDLW